LQSPANDVPDREVVIHVQNSHWGPRIRPESLLHNPYA
jgi:hypothetical protein